MKKMVGYAGLVIGAIALAVFLKLALPDHALEALKEFLKVAVMLSVESFKILAELAVAAWSFLSSFLSSFISHVQVLWEQVSFPELPGNWWAMIWALGIALLGFAIYRFCGR